MNNLNIGDKVIVFKRYGSEHTLTSIIDISHSNLTLENGDIVNPKLTTSLSIFKYDEQKVEDALFEHRMNLVIKSLNHNKKLRHKIPKNLLDEIENVIEISNIKIKNDQALSECYFQSFRA